MLKRALPGRSIYEIADYLQTSGEAGADLGSGIEQILVRGGWVTTGGVDRQALGKLWLHAPGTAERRLADVIRRMYGKDEEWDADLGPDIERILKKGEDDGLPFTNTVAGAAAGALVAGPIGAVIGGVLGHFFGEEEKSRLPRAVVYNDVLGMGATDEEARADALARGEALEMAEYVEATPAALFAWKNGRTDLVILAPNGAVHRIDVNDTPEDWKGTPNDPAWDSDEWRRPRRAPRTTAARRRRPR